jgi:hypothetical protein
MAGFGHDNALDVPNSLIFVSNMNKTYRSSEFYSGG